MPAIRVNPGAFYYAVPDDGGGGSFHPRGQLLRVGVRENPSRDSSKNTLAARLFVGFNVDGEPVWDLDDLIEVVGRIRLDQGRQPDASFLAQRGVYSHTHTGEVVTEDSAQIILIDMSGQSINDFADEMVDLADQICLEMSQETVIVEIQRNGVTKVTHFVGPDA